MSEFLRRQSELSAITERENYIHAKLTENDELIKKLNNEVHDLYIELMNIPRKKAEAERALAEAQYTIDDEQI